MLSVPAQRQRPPLEPQARVPDLPRAGAEPAYQTAQTYRAREARATGCSASQQPVLVDGFHARLIVGQTQLSGFKSDLRFQPGSAEHGN